MQRTVLHGLLLLLLPFGTIGVSLHDLVKRDAHGGHEWGYEEQNGPAHWKSFSPTCGGIRQSPVNIDTSQVKVNEELDEFEFDSDYDDDFEDAIMENNGHTVQISPGPRDAPRIIKGGGLNSEYQFLQLHFHWGSKENQGSEHEIDGEAYEMEMHLVHMNTNYKTIENATHMTDGLAVLGVMFELSKEDNPDLQPIIEHLRDVKKEGKKFKVDQIDLKSLLPDNTMPYYRYKGSLTTPPCSEVVVWTVFHEAVPIGRKQLEEFRHVTEEDKGESAEPLVDNFRPPQELNGRVVEVSAKSNSATRAVGASVVLLLAAALAVLL